MGKTAAVQIFFFRAMPTYQSPEAKHTRLQPAQNQIRKGDGR